MLITAYGKLGDFNGAEKVLGLMNKNGYVPNVVSQTALMEAYGKGGRYNNAEAIFRRMQKWGPEPSAFTYQIILKTFVHATIYSFTLRFYFPLIFNLLQPLVGVVVVVLLVSCEFFLIKFKYVLCLPSY